MSYRIPVAEGGTGAGALAPGYVRANGASAFTSVERIPASDIDGALSAAGVNFTATDRILGRVSAGAGPGEEIVCTAAARSILDDASTGAIRTTLGLGTADNPTFNGLILTAALAMAAGIHISLSGGGQLISTTSTGTAPLVVSSTTKVANLNADLLDGIDGAAFAQLAGATFTGTVRVPLLEVDGTSFYLDTDATYSSIYFDATDRLEFNRSTNDLFLRIGGTTVIQAYVGEVDVSGILWASSTVSGNTLTSRVATGTAPIAVSSTTLCANLNADMVDGIQGASLAQLGGATFTGTVRVPLLEIDGATFYLDSDATYSSVYFDTNDRIEFNKGTNQFLLRIGGSTVINADSTETDITTGLLWTSATFSANILVSRVTTGTAPLTITSTTVCANLNADLLDGQHGSFYQNAGNLNAGTLPDARYAAGTTWVSTLSASGGGSFTTTSQACSYTRHGDRCFFEADITLTDIGTGVGTLQFTVPFTIQKVFCAHGREVVNTGNSVQAYVTSAGGALVAVNYYNNGGVLANGNRFIISGHFQI